MGLKSYVKKKYRYAKNKYGQLQQWREKQAIKADQKRAREIERLKVDTSRAQEQVKLARARAEIAKIRAQERKYSSSGGGMFGGFGGGGSGNLFGSLPTFGGAPATGSGGSTDFLSGVPGIVPRPAPVAIGKPRRRKTRRTHRARPKRRKARYRWVRQRVG